MRRWLLTVMRFLGFAVKIVVRICMCCPDAFDRYHYRTVPWGSGGRQNADHFVSHALMCVARAMNSAMHRGKFVSDGIA